MLPFSASLSHSPVLRTGRAICLVLFAMCVLGVVLGSFPPAHAQVQLLTNSAEGTENEGLERLIEDARKNGSTVIVVQPPGMEMNAPETNMRAMRAERFLEARNRIGRIAAGLPGLPERMATNFAEASPDGSGWWLIRALATALLGSTVAFLITIPVYRWAVRQFPVLVAGTPETTSDKVRYLLVRTIMSVMLLALSFFIALAVAVVLDSGHEPARRVIFEAIVAYTAYRFVRHGISWNLFAGNMPRYRLVNLSDDEAVGMHRFFHIGFAVLAALYALVRITIITGGEQARAGLEGGVNRNDVALLQIGLALFATVALAIYVIGNWRKFQHIFAPRDPSAPLYKLRTGLAKLVPVAILVYGVIAMGVFVFRLALGLPAPGLVLVAPFLALYLGVLAYALAMTLIAVLYDYRKRRFEAKVQAARAEHEAALGVTPNDNEEMVVGTDVPQMVYQPMFRDFLEQGALLLISTIAIGELGRLWGVRVGETGNWLAGGLDMIASVGLAWIAYQAVCRWIDHRMALESGPVEVDEEAMGNEGGAGASRIATLLPIVRYVLIAIIFVAAVVVVLSRFGIDIGPIIAGAGVVGIAVGFGAQKLIQDVFSGAFFLLDDAFRKGEYVEIEGIKGVVEKISIRSFQLRHHLGALHTLPFGEIKQLTNYSRDWVMMKLPLRVTYDTDVEKVRKLVKKLGQQLLEHPQVGHTFMQPLKSQGVYKMEDSAMIIRVKFMTKPGEQFVTRKIVYESIQDLFAREGIHFAHKEVTVRLADGQKADNLSEDERKAVMSAARTVIDGEEAAALEAAGGGGSGDR